jgi:hypothetical protein
MKNNLFRKIRRKIVVIKFTMARGYIWCQTPTMALIGAGVIKPYFPMLQFYQLCLIGFGIFLGVGYIDRKFGFLTEEQGYGTEMNSLLMKGLRGELKQNGDKR